MRFTDNVTGSQVNKPNEIEFNAMQVYGRRNIVRETVTDEQGNETKVWKYDECMLEEIEYQQVTAGILPNGAEWNDFLRWFERRPMYEYADDMISKANEKIALGVDADSWTTYRDEMYAYKSAIRDTVKSASYPATVDYPDLPEQPE